MGAEDLTKSGFTLVAEVMTDITHERRIDGFSASQNAAAPVNGDVSLTSLGDVAFSNLEGATFEDILTLFKVTYDVDTTGLSSGESIVVHVERNNSATGTTWTETATQRYSAGQDITATKEFWAGMGHDYDLRLRVSGDLGDTPGTFTVTAHGEDNTTPGVQYDAVTSATIFSMTPDPDDSVLWQAKAAA